MPRQKFLTERGAVAVEFAMVLPLLVVLVFGIIEFGRGYNAKVTLTHAAREAVRDYTVHLEEDRAVATGRDAAANLEGVRIEIIDPCTGDDNDTAEVRVRADFAYTIPLVHEGSVELAEEAVMRCGG